MENRTEYDIWYNDEDKVRHKRMIYTEQKNQIKELLYFWNEQRKKEEIIPINNIIRMEKII